MSIVSEFTQFAIDDGPNGAINTLEDILSSLETLAEVSNEDEREACSLLIDAVNTATGDILAGESWC